ncbi:patatin-like phospholipase family protein [Photobacterium sp. DNB23_23_1]|uniref:Patatin-like phospholipase family protein n=1 Tax=Photobacterium pectinilyticum TaxID=2906793 RepID=A0ABT1N2P5_9GAMM|nr:patatin-like phospholipase family protein [Photobacterium sp. ZSDE20]MCQ1058984.1 patatin-like phospholipase family protein [Photobacterium sp. ZSDE20]MDD1824001.1 patatin-like phospholipase family protein [Photobacterium sp. ZSDE20]
MRSITLSIGLISTLIFAGCAGIIREQAVPEYLTNQAVVPGMEDVRYRLGIDTEALKKDAFDSFWREAEQLKASGHSGPLPPVHFLVISGGGDHGAFGAGLLSGWTSSGTRPEFKLVTGVSTGALIAPFAFLGSEYDARLRNLYTNISAEDIIEQRWFLAALTSDAMADTSPLWELLEKEIDERLLEAIAVEHDKGRMLLIATVDLDARNSVIWNMTKIAASGDPKALHLFRSVLIASASIPGAFPPVMIDVEARGQHYQEMHVDGGTMSQLFIYPPELHTKEISEKQHVERERYAYIIRNAKLDPKWASVERQTMSIAERAISSLIQTQGVGDLYRVYLITQRDGVDYNLAYVPEDFNHPHHEEFDTEFMRALFQTGYEMALRGYPWSKMPPGF